MFLSDAATAMLLHLGGYDSFYRVSVYVRAPIEFYWIFLLCRHKRGGKIIIVLAFFGLGSLIGSIAEISYVPHYHFVQSIVETNKFLICFVVWYTLKYYFVSSEDRNKLFRTYELIVLIQSISVISGFMFDIDLFSSYWDFGQQQIIRYGYKGLIPAQNEASGFFIIALFYFANVTSTGQKNALPKFILVWIAMVLTGTKVCLVAFPILLLYILYWLKRRKNAALPMLGITIIAVFCSLYYIDFIMDEIAISIDYFTQSLARNKSNMITVVSSGRNLMMKQTLSYIFKVSIQ